MLVDRLRSAVQFCKGELGMTRVFSDHKMDAEQRLSIEQCLTKNYLIAKGSDYFGKRDLLYIDM
jgi:hypothetical protein